METWRCYRVNETKPKPKKIVFPKRKEVKVIRVVDIYECDPDGIIYVEC